MIVAPTVPRDKWFLFGKASNKEVFVLRNLQLHNWLDENKSANSLFSIAIVTEA
jgi:hypothetical protein